MPLARIISPTREDALPLADRLQSHGYTVQIVGSGEACDQVADLEIELETMKGYEALAHAARLSQGKQVNVLVAPGCLEAPQSEPEAAPIAQQMLDAAEQESYELPVEAEPVPFPAEDTATPSRVLEANSSSSNDVWAKLRVTAEAIGVSARQLFSRTMTVLQRMRAGAGSTFLALKEKCTVGCTRFMDRWSAQRQQREIAAQQRQQAKSERLRIGELERARHLLEQQEERRREAIHKRLADEEHAKQRLIEEQLRRVREAEEEERLQMEREAQLERQRQEALRLAEEREKVARERFERERQTEEARRMRAEEAERRRRENEEKVLLQRGELFRAAKERGEQRADETRTPVEQPAPEEPVIAAPGNSLNEIQETPAPQTPEEPLPAETVPAYAYASHPRRSRVEPELSPYHPGWTWAAAAAGAATVAIMLLWTAVSASHSAMHFEALSPSSLLPPRASQIQQQVPFGPVKVVVKKSGPVAPVKVVPTSVPVLATPVAMSTTPVATAPPVEPRKTRAGMKPSAAKNQIASPETSVDGADSGPEVVVRHFTAPVKAVPQAGQTATVKHYSDMN